MKKPLLPSRLAFLFEWSTPATRTGAMLATGVLALSLLAIFAGAFSFLPRAAFAADVRWQDGQEAPEPRDFLLTNNPGYWGKTIPTQVDYSYPEAPTNPPDTPGVGQTGNGNRLLDGQPGGDWTSPVGVDAKPLVVDFNFHQQISLSEVRVAQYNSRDLKLAQIEIKTDPAGDWEPVFSTTDSKGALHHLILPAPVSARYVRLTVQSASTITWISQVWMSGEAKPVETAFLNGYWPEMKNFPETENAEPGDATILSAEALQRWRETTGFVADGLTWQVAFPGQMTANNFLESEFLPGKSALRQPVQITATKSEGESAALFLVNADDKAKEVTVNLETFKDQNGNSAASISGQLSVAGAIWTRRWGHTLRPLFSRENKLGGALMQKYLTNGAVIKDFPTLHLPPHGTVMLWITVVTENAPPGNYTAVLSDGENRIPIQLKVLPVALPMPDVWVRFWGNAPAGLGNLWSTPDAVRRELEYQQAMGASVYESWPVPGSYVDTARQVARESGRRIYIVKGIDSSNIRDAGYLSKLDAANLGEAVENEVREQTLQMARTARELGFSYDDWSMELWDEPNMSNMASWAAVARLVKATDPKVQMYMNPLFWVEGSGFADDQRQVGVLGDWYNQLVDISVPIMGQTDNEKFPEANRQFYNHLPRAVRAYFIHPNPGRMLSWEAFVRNYNGWGAYAYYAPRKDAWNDFDHAEFDYQIVYPGPAGFVPTIESEAMRESWEDYRLLVLLRQQGKIRELENILQIYKSSSLVLPLNETPADRDRRSISASEKLPVLREMMLNALTTHEPRR